MWGEGRADVLVETVLHLHHHHTLRMTLHPNPPRGSSLSAAAAAAAAAAAGGWVDACTTAYPPHLPALNPEARHGSPSGPSSCLIPDPNHRMTHMEMSGGHKPKLSQGSGFGGRESEGITLTQYGEVHRRAWNNKPRAVK